MRPQTLRRPGTGEAPVPHQSGDALQTAELVAPDVSGDPAAFDQAADRMDQDGTGAGRGAFAREALVSLKQAVRPLQTRVLFPVRHLFQLRSWQATRSGPVVVVYHGVEHRVHDPRMQPFCLTADQFRDNLSEILDRHEVVSLDRVVDALKAGETLSPRWAVLTFDDGYVNNLTVACPILKAFGDLPATIYVCPGLVERRSWLTSTRVRMAVLYCPAKELVIRSLGMKLRLGPPRARTTAFKQLLSALRTADFERRSEAADEAMSGLPVDLRSELERRFRSEDLVTWAQLEELARMPNITIGGHTMHHTILHAEQSAEMVHREVSECRTILEQRLGRPVRHFAYPGGANCPAAHAAVKAAGYESATTIVPGEIRPSSDRFLLPRLHPSPHRVVLRRRLACAGMPGRQHGWWF